MTSGEYRSTDWCSRCPRRDGAHGGPVPSMEPARSVRAVHAILALPIKYKGTAIELR